MDLMTFLLLLIILFPMLNYWTFEDAGISGYKALIPFYNYYVWLQLIGKPWWWLILMLIPFINLFMIMLMLVQTAVSYAKHNLRRTGFGCACAFCIHPLPWHFGKGALRETCRQGKS